MSPLFFRLVSGRTSTRTEAEPRLRKVATRGVIKLFNAVREAQKSFEKEEKVHKTKKKAQGEDPSSSIPLFPPLFLHPPVQLPPPPSLLEDKRMLCLALTGIQDELPYHAA